MITDLLIKYNQKHLCENARKFKKKEMESFKLEQTDDLNFEIFYKRLCYKTNKITFNSISDKPLNAVKICL